MPSIIANVHTNIGCSYHRVELPAMYMRDRVLADPYGIVILPNAPRLDGLGITPGSILFFNRVPTMSEEHVLEMKDKLRLKIVVDIDDHWILYPHHEMAQAWRDTKTNEQIERWIRIADMVFVTNERLKIAASNINSNVHIVKNSLPFGHYQFGSLHDRRRPIDIIYAAGSSHLYDLSELKGLMKRLGTTKEFSSTVPRARVVLAGYNREFGNGHVNTVWDQMLNIIKLAKSWGVLPQLPVYEYMRLYNGTSISIAPLQRNTFNECKSNLKTIEAGCKGIPIIASYVEPYIQDMECEGVILCDTQREWFDAIMRLVTNEEEIRRLGDNLRIYTDRRYGMAETAIQRVRLFESLLGRKLW